MHNTSKVFSFKQRVTGREYKLWDHFREERKLESRRGGFGSERGVEDESCLRTDWAGLSSEGRIYRLRLSKTALP